MRKRMISILLTGLILLSGCGQSAVTSTDVTEPRVTAVDVVSSSPAQPESTVGVLPKKKAEGSSQSQKTPAEPEEKPKVRALAYPSWEWGETDYCWEKGIGRAADSTGFVRLCNTREDLLEYLNRYQQPARCADDYPEEYFETSSLLVFDGLCNDLGTYWYPEGLWVEDDVLQVSLMKETIGGSGQLVVYRLYRLEIPEKLEQIRTVRAQVTVQYREKKGAEPLVRQQETMDYPIAEDPKTQILTYDPWGTYQDKLAKAYFWQDADGFAYDGETHLGRVALCNTYEEYAAFWQEQGGIPYHAGAYDQEYFRYNSLLLFEAYAQQDNAGWYLDELSLTDGVLLVSLRDRIPSVERPDTGEYRIYRQEIREHLPGVDTVRCQVSRQKVFTGGYTDLKEITKEYPMQ